MGSITPNTSQEKANNGNCLDSSEAIPKKFIRDIMEMAGNEMTEAAHLDSLKKRVQIFTEGILKTLCPFIFAVILMAPKKDDNQSTGYEKEDSMHSVENVLARGIISPLAVINVDAGIMIYSILLLVPEIWWTEGSNVLFLIYKGSIHLLGILLMAFASVLHLMVDSIGEHLLYLLLPITLGLFISIHGYCSWQNGQQEDADLYAGCGDRLEASVDFSASVTFLLFLAFQGLVLGGPHEGLSTPLAAISFASCVVGVFFMTLDTAPLLIRNNNNGNDVCNLLEICNWILAIFLGAIVMLITFETLGHAGLAVLLIPVLVTLCAWVTHSLDLDDRETEEELAVKPASLELIKVTFPGFLAISAAVHGALGSKDPISIDTHWFLFLTATGVNTGLLWRLLTHVKTPSIAIAKVSALASLSARVLIVAAVIPFAVMAGRVISSAKKVT